MTQKYIKPLARSLGEVYSAQGACISGSTPTGPGCTTGTSANTGSAAACATGYQAAGHPGYSSCYTGIGVVKG